MKLRIKGNSLRLRLTQPEVNAIGQGEAVEETMHFPDGTSLKYRFQPVVQDTELAVHFSDGLLSVRVGLRTAAKWSADSAVELSYVFPLPNGGELRVLVEKDFECLHLGSSGLTDGAFPNPARPNAAILRTGSP